MSKRMSEWEVQQVANNLDRMNSYRMNKGSGQEYVDPSAFSGRVSEWDAQQIANNLDRINSYRMENMDLSQTLLVIKLCLIFFVLIIIGVLAINAPDILVGLFVVVISVGIGVSVSSRRK